MRNSYFQFKHFTVQQEKSAMKVSTDACILGALAMTYWKRKNDVHSVLDIGTGTGLLSLFAAQQLKKAQITAIDIEFGAFEQANSNFSATPWSQRLSAKHLSLQELVSVQSEKFDAIICNPPFFENDLPSANETVRMARHSSHLSLEILLRSIDHLLLSKGTAVLLLPIKRLAELKLLLGETLLLFRQIDLQNSQEHAAKLCIVFIQKNGIQRFRKEVLYLKDTDGTYTERFQRFMKPYYLDTVFKNSNS